MKKLDNTIKYFEVPLISVLSDPQYYFHEFLPQLDKAIFFHLTDKTFKESFLNMQTIRFKPKVKKSSSPRSKIKKTLPRLRDANSVNMKELIAHCALAKSYPMARWLFFVPWSASTAISNLLSQINNVQVWKEPHMWEKLGKNYEEWGYLNPITWNLMVDTAIKMTWRDCADPSDKFALQQTKRVLKVSDHGNRIRGYLSGHPLTYKCCYVDYPLDDFVCQVLKEQKMDRIKWIKSTNSDLAELIDPVEIMVKFHIKKRANKLHGHINAVDYILKPINTAIKICGYLDIDVPDNLDELIANQRKTHSKRKESFNVQAWIDKRAKQKKEFSIDINRANELEKKYIDEINTCGDFKSNLDIAKPHVDLSPIVKEPQNEN